MKVIFKYLPPLILNIADTTLGQQYKELVKKNYENEFPIFRDRAKYTIEYMLQLAREAKKKLGWDWSFDHYDIGITALLHKDIERLVGNGFSSIPAELDNLIHELHYCLHVVQDPKHKKRDGWLQIEWYNDSGFNLTGTDIFSHTMKFGDLRLQNPYVGHGPLQIFLEKDFTNIPQTCKFHNFVKPGINISLQDFNFPVNTDLILSQFKTHAPEFVEQHTEKTIKNYIGYPIIGNVSNLEDLHKVVNAPLLELERIDFE